MGFSVNTNLAALNTFRNLTTTQTAQAKSLEKLSSGLRINRAADDAAGLSIAEGLKAQVNGYNVAQRNAQDGISVIQVAEGAYAEAQAILQRMRDLAVQGANDTNSGDARAAIQAELNELTAELGRIASSTNFNGTQLLGAGEDGAAVTDLSIQVGADGAADNAITIDLTTANLDSILSDLDAATNVLVGDHDEAQGAITALDAAIDAVSDVRSKLGATQNRLEYASTVAAVAAENLAAAESRIRDVDMAAEMTKFTKLNILQQAGTSMLAQANQAPQGVLSLLR